MDDGAARLCAGKHRHVQEARVGERKLFDAARRKVFLEWFAATANVKMSAGQAGVCYQTVFKHRMKDAAFAAAWDEALAQGYARVEAKMLETKGTPIEIDGDLDAPELDELDPQLGLALLREHAKRVGLAFPAGQARKAGRPPRVASEAEVAEALVARLVVFGAGVRGEIGRAGPPPPRGESPITG